ncbi:hypothetical protein ACFV3E_11385 [Streptomyces sp. NPDC059718]
MNTDDPAQLHGARRKDRSARPPHRPRPPGLFVCVRAPWTGVVIVAGPYAVLVVLGAPWTFACLVVACPVLGVLVVRAGGLLGRARRRGTARKPVRDCAGPPPAPA